jgi:hypothetical protein
MDDFSHKLNVTPEQGHEANLLTVREMSFTVEIMTSFRIFCPPIGRLPRAGILSVTVALLSLTFATEEHGILGALIIWKKTYNHRKNNNKLIFIHNFLLF